MNTAEHIFTNFTHPCYHHLKQDTEQITPWDFLSNPTLNKNAILAFRKGLL